MPRLARIVKCSRSPPTPKHIRPITCSPSLVDLLMRVPLGRDAQSTRHLLGAQPPRGRRTPIWAMVEADRASSSGGGDEGGNFSGKFLENTAATIASVAMLAVGGYSYHLYYKRLVLQKIENVFLPGFSTMEQASLAQGNLDSDGIPAAQHQPYRVIRPEQSIIDAIVHGTAVGNYWLLFGEKGTGKTSMLLQSMRKANGAAVAMLEAHGDLEVFRLRLGKALDYEFHEDYIGGLFSIKGPRDSTALLDVERALNKLEKVAVRHRDIERKPLVLIMTNIHHIQGNPEGNHLLTLLQQRAELWAASGLITLVFTTDEYRTTEILRPHATRMQVMNVQDVPKDLAVQSLRKHRQEVFREEVSIETLENIYGKVGGRLIFLDRIARSKDMLKECESICASERRWFLSKCWILGKDMDEKGEDQQECSAAAMVLAKALVELEKSRPVSDLPGIPLHKAQELMTRTDFMHKLDQMNIIAIDTNSMVKADSMPMQNAFREVYNEEGFHELLEETLQRLDEIESLGRTSELTMKDLVHGGEYEIVQKDKPGACDACRRRKVKCNTQRPCTPCRAANLACHTSGVRLKKGRQGRTANVLTELRQTDPSTTQPILSPETLTSSSSPQTTRDDAARADGLFRKRPGLLDAQRVQNCADYFFARMTGTVPILHPDIFQKHIAQMDRDDGLPSYCLVVAFCAFVLVQTGYLSWHGESSPDLVRALLDEATAARRHLDPFAAPVRQGITVAFLLYGCHIGFGNQRHAYYFLREATTLYTAGMLDPPGADREDDDDDDDHAAFQDKLFWLLLISERAHAIRRHRPITLQITPDSPTLDTSRTDDPFGVGFSCLVELYRSFDESFLSLWNGTKVGYSRDSLVQLEDHLRRAVPSDLELPDILMADLRVSQQWLRTMIWQLATTAGFLSSTPTHPCLDFRYPLQIARDLSLATWKLSRDSMETHGIGLIEKVFEVACTLTDVMACLTSTGLRSSGFEMGPQDYLKHLVSLVSTLPGGRRRFLPLLLTKIGQTLPVMLQPISRHLNLPDRGDTPTVEEEKDQAILSEFVRDFNWAEMSRIGDKTPEIDEAFRL
ncbi:hypothetical protein FE257_003612 [Aspergillus nanangensis]|uniref:Zn(2)-C6 fungal-type domain-containing protein n=1 Tax=Aspergillus nanangensis TaxID=2582783 RepID=A0AAD4CRW4_ASPNN|nr:hypothetical protein FE257_003612 [Aspergillus nanangensis]